MNAVEAGGGEGGGRLGGGSGEKPQNEPVAVIEFFLVLYHWNFYLGR